MIKSTACKAAYACGLLTGFLHKLTTAVFAVLIAGPQLLAQANTITEPTSALFHSHPNQDEKRDIDFRLGAPKGFFGIRIGRFFPQAKGDIYDLITDRLTLKRSDFRAWDFGCDLGASVRERIDLIFSLDYLKRSKDSMFRYYVDERDLPITQTTGYEKLPLTGGVRFLLVPRGRPVGKYAWLPSSIVPYLGGGVGVAWYRFEQEGDFVDERTLEIFPAHLKSMGWTPTAYAGGGADLRLSKSTFLTLDLRYSWARPELKRDFVAFDAMDLSGLRVSMGLRWHF